ncbi:8891_t:CDS:1, partial [Ambispora gerdemannii]
MSKIPRNFAKFSKENFDKLRNQWETEAYLEISKNRLREHADQIIEAKWGTLEGCTARCPTCDSKCEDIKGTRYTQHTSAHVITAFGGYRYVHSRETGLVVCSEKASHELRWKGNNIDQFVELNMLMDINQPPWLKIEPKDVADNEIRNMRGDGGIFERNGVKNM